jgi:hypothetical protein
MLAAKIDALRRSLGGRLDETYETERPFRDRTLGDACLVVIRDAPYKWLTRLQIEYLVGAGGFQSKAKDENNSVQTTLRRLVESGQIESWARKGGHMYSYKGPGPADTRRRRVKGGR